MLGARCRQPRFMLGEDAIRQSVLDATIHFVVDVSICQIVARPAHICLLLESSELGKGWAAPTLR